jgi:hypothetical protein
MQQHLLTLTTSVHRSTRCIQTARPAPSPPAPPPQHTRSPQASSGILQQEVKAARKLLLALRHCRRQVAAAHVLKVPLHDGPGPGLAQALGGRGAEHQPANG